jgi:hypothetical protein
MSIADDITAAGAGHSGQKSRGRLVSAAKKLSSGNRIDSAGVDAADLGISEKLRSRAYWHTVRSAGDAVPPIQTAGNTPHKACRLLHRMDSGEVGPGMDAAKSRRCIQEAAGLDQKTVKDGEAGKSKFYDIEFLGGSFSNNDPCVGAKTGRSFQDHPGNAVPPGGGCTNALPYAGCNAVFLVMEGKPESRIVWTARYLI